LPDDQVLRLRVIEDLNGNGRWDRGLLTPFQPPERLGWLPETPPVRARWETVLPDTLRLRPLLPRALPPTPPDSTSNQP
ncbi:MAG: hypothetical protein HKN29_05630, partial [Rhodothermales bacterium]|nr:hypothetical protein [Rhodothermales bacterium]